MSKHTMNVSLTPELERVVHGLVENGMYGNQSEVIRAAIRLLDEHETERATKLEALRREVGRGISQMVAGEVSEVTAEDFKAKGRNCL
jgi:antitoxin ParD1/3/4